MLRKKKESRGKSDFLYFICWLNSSIWSKFSPQKTIVIECNVVNAFMAKEGWSASFLFKLNFIKRRQSHDAASCYRVSRAAGLIASHINEDVFKTKFFLELVLRIQRAAVALGTAALHLQDKTQPDFFNYILTRKTKGWAFTDTCVQRNGPRAAVYKRVSLRLAKNLFWMFYSF